MEKLTSRQKGTNPRAKGTNPRALGTNPRRLKNHKHNWFPYKYIDGRIFMEDPYGNRSYFGSRDPYYTLTELICIVCQKKKKFKILHKRMNEHRKTTKTT